MNIIKKYGVIYSNNKAPILFKKSIYRTARLKSFVGESIRWDKNNFYCDSLRNRKIIYTVHGHY